MLSPNHTEGRRFRTAAAKSLPPLPRAARRLTLVLAALLLAAATARAQQAPPGAIGRVEGLDISVEGGTAGGSGGATTAPSIYVASGSVVTVHSGKAQMTLAAGGQIDICGPARITLLQSGDAVTVALSFGRIHLQLPAATALRIFTPTIIATPLDINGGARDVTLGLDVHDSLCVHAANGALRLEHQFSGENLVVPQTGEFFLDGGKLSPIAGASGGCQCQVARAQVVVPPPPIPEPSMKPIPLAPVIEAKAPAAQTAPNQPPASTAVAPQAAPPSGTSVEFSVLAKPNDAHPVARSPKSEELAPPPEYQPIYKIVMPPLTFSSASPAAPPDPSLDTVLLVRIARVEPIWEFKGRVEAPPLDGKTRAASAPSSGGSQPPFVGAKDKPKSGNGFWARLKHLFGGGTVEAAPKP
jgi:hypothetical protein